MVNIDYFSINATFDFKLPHTTNATKKLRFLSLKGAVEDGKIRWWRDEREFMEYALGICPIGWEKRTRRIMRQTMEQSSRSSDADKEDAVEGGENRMENVHTKDWRRPKRKHEPTSKGSH